jgi:hypothetical protein
MKTSFKLAATAVGLLALVAAKPAPVSVSFPGPGVANDPKGHYFVECRVGSYASPNGLLLTEVRSRTSILFWEFRKRADVLWSGDGRYLAVTDFGADDVPDVLVFRLSEPGTPVRLSDVLRRTKGLFRNKLTRRGVPRLEADSWQSGSSLRVRATSADTEAPYETFVEYRIGRETLRESED